MSTINKKELTAKDGRIVTVYQYEVVPKALMEHVKMQKKKIGEIKKLRLK